MVRAWIAVASAEHVRIGRAAGFMQVCYGKAAPLRRISPGDRVIYYSPTVTFGGKDRLQAFTAIGVTRDRSPYQVESETGFMPWRRDVDWQQADETPIRPLLDLLAVTQGVPNWGYRFRFGLFGIDRDDADRIADAMMPAGRKVPRLPAARVPRRAPEPKLASFRPQGAVS